MVNSERPSVPPPGGYEEPDVVNSERPPVGPPGGYEEPDVVNSEQPPVRPPVGDEEPDLMWLIHNNPLSLLQVVEAYWFWMTTSILHIVMVQ